MVNEHRTPAQLAGLIRSPKTEHEVMVEEIATTVRGADGLTFMERKAAQKLARRRELFAEATALAEADAKAADDIERQRQRALERLTRAEQEWRAAQEAARALPLWSPESPRIGTIRRELIETCDPRLRELQAWLAREADVTRAYGPPLEIVDDGSSRRGLAGRAGFEQNILRALERRQVAIREAMAAASATMLEAATEAELESKIEQILALVPPIPEGASQQGPLPAPLTIDGRLPSPHVQERETKIAAVGEQHKRAAKSDGRARR